MDHEDDSDTNCGWCTWNNPKRIGKESGRRGNKKTNRDHPDNCIIKIGQNTEKSLGDLRRLTATQTLVRKYPLTQVIKIDKEVNDNYNNNNNDRTFQIVDFAVPGEHKPKKMKRDTSTQTLPEN